MLLCFTIACFYLLYSSTNCFMLHFYFISPSLLPYGAWNAVVRRAVKLSNYISICLKLTNRLEVSACREHVVRMLHSAIRQTDSARNSVPLKRVWAMKSMRTSVCRAEPFNSIQLFFYVFLGFHVAATLKALKSAITGEVLILCGTSYFTVNSKQAVLRLKLCKSVQVYLSGTSFR